MPIHCKETKKNEKFTERAKCKFVIVRQFGSCIQLSLAHNSPKVDNYVIQLWMK